MKKLTFIFAILLAFTMSANAQDLNSFKRTKEKTKEFIKEFKKVGYIKKIDMPNQKIWVKESNWNVTPGPQKEVHVRLFADYMGMLFDLDHKMGLWIKSYQTGRTLATYGIWGGVKIKQ